MCEVINFSFSPEITKVVDSTRIPKKKNCHTVGMPF